MGISDILKDVGAGVDIASGVAGLFGGKKGGGVGADFYWHQLELQKQLAQNGIQWRVDDAKRAGIHPLFALGAQPMSISPVSAFNDSRDSSVDHFAAAGQDLSRALKATATDNDLLQNKMNLLSVERGELENELLRSQIAREKAALGPPVPASPAGLGGDFPPEAYGQLKIVPPSAHIEDKPQERVTSSPERPHSEPGAITDVGWVRTPTGVAPVPSKDAKERIEDQLIPEIMWSWRNNIVPMFSNSDRVKPPFDMLPDGYNDWEWSMIKQEWQPAKNWFKGQPKDSRPAYDGSRTLRKGDRVRSNY